MQLNEIKTGWFRKRLKFHGTLMAADLESLGREVDTFVDEANLSLEAHGRPCGEIELFIASGLQSIRAIRPQMRELLQNHTGLKALCRQCRVTACFLTRTGDREDYFRVH